MQVQIHNEKRSFHRVFYSANASLHSSEKVWPCQVIDLCLKGCLLRFADPWQGDLQQVYTLILKLSDSVEIRMALQPAHIVGCDVGFKCVHVGIDSISQLRRLVELNLGNSDLLERDLLALVASDTA